VLAGLGNCAGVDLCIGVTCNTPPDCQLGGTCQHGECVYLNQLDSTPCSDGIDNTVNDMCMSGFCNGINLCDGVVCEAVNQCHDTGTCDSKTGICNVNPKADGTQCDDLNPETASDIVSLSLPQHTPAHEAHACA